MRALLLLLCGFFVGLSFAQSGAPAYRSPKIQLQDWGLSDWNDTAGDFSNGVNFAYKKYLYESQVAFDTSIYDSLLYELPVFTTDWGFVTSPVPNVGIPGPFPYTQSWADWGGDETYNIGVFRYPLILADFGHTHIMAIQIKNAMLMENPNANLTHIQLTLDRLAGGSSFIFARFAKLVDQNGNFLSTAGDTPLVQQIKGLMKYFIFGTGVPYGQPGANLDINQIGSFFSQMINVYAQSPAHAALLGDIVTRLQDSLARQLGYYAGTPVPLVAWDPLMKAHQAHTSKGFVNYRDTYFPVSEQKIATKLNDTNAMYRQGVVFGKQMGAFFSAFYGFLDFMDKLLIVQDPFYDQYVIPMAYHIQRTLRIYSDQRRYWAEHVTMFEDYNKACAMQDQTEMYRVRITMLESCSNIATTLGEVFRAMDRLVTVRDLFGVLATM